MNICLDTSLIIKFLTKEPDSDVVDELFRHWLNEEDRLLTPQFTKYETYSVLRKKNFLKEITDEQLDQAIKDFLSLNIDLIADLPLLPKAISWSQRLNLPTIYDCIYLCAAEIENAFFWTCDKKFLNAARKEFPKIKCAVS